MYGLIGKKLLVCVLVVLYGSEKCIARSLSENQDRIEKIFSELVSDKDVVAATYNVQTDDEYATICWIEKTTLHFLNNGSDYGDVEYSISMELSPEDPTFDDNVTSKEPYEIHDSVSQTPRILDFVTISSDNEETVKENKTTVCKSDKAYARIFINFVTKKKIEVKLKPVVQDFQFNPLQDQHQISTRVLTESEDEDEGKSDLSKTEEGTSAPEITAEDQLAETTDPPDLEFRIDETTDQNVESTERIDASSDVSQVGEMLSDANDDNGKEIMSSRTFDDWSQQDNPCSSNRMVSVKVKMDIADDSGKIQEVYRDINIDLDTPYHSIPSTASFDQQLTSLVRDYFGESLNKHKLCPQNTFVQSFPPSYNNYGQLYPSNLNYMYQPQNRISSFYSGGNSRYYVVPRQQTPSIFQSLRNTYNNMLTNKK